MGVLCTFKQILAAKFIHKSIRNFRFPFVGFRRICRRCDTEIPVKIGDVIAISKNGGLQGYLEDTAETNPPLFGAPLFVGLACLAQAAIAASSVRPRGDSI